MNYFRRTQIGDWSPHKIYECYIEDYPEKTRSQVIDKIKKDLWLHSLEATPIGAAAARMLQNWNKVSPRFPKQTEPVAMSSNTAGPSKTDSTTNHVEGGVLVDRSHVSIGELNMNLHNTHGSAKHENEENVSEPAKKSKVHGDSDTGSVTVLEQPLHPSPLTSESGSEEQFESVWQQWSDFMEAAKTNEEFNKYSPEKAGIIQCGNGVRRRANLPSDLFYGLQQKLQREGETRRNSAVFRELKEYIDRVLDAIDLPAMKNAVDQAPNGGTLTIFTRDVFRIFSDSVYEPENPPLDYSEIALNFYVIWPALRACTRCIARICTERPSFYPGEEKLVAMSKQLAKADLRRTEVYNADGIIRFKNNFDLEVVLLETSNGLGKADATKVAFDHTKGMFGTLAMLKEVADTFPYGDFNTFSQVHIHFMHVHGTAIRHWTLSSPTPDLYLLTKQAREEIPVSFDRKADDLLPFLSFCSRFERMVDESGSAIAKLRQSHEERSRELRFSSDRPTLLSDVVHPTIFRLVERKHGTSLRNEAPNSSPNDQWY